MVGSGRARAMVLAITKPISTGTDSGAVCQSSRCKPISAPVSALSAITRASFLMFCMVPLSGGCGCGAVALVLV